MIVSRHFVPFHHQARALISSVSDVLHSPSDPNTKEASKDAFNECRTFVIGRALVVIGRISQWDAGDSSFVYSRIVKGALFILFTIQNHYLIFSLSQSPVLSFDRVQD